MTAATKCRFEILSHPSCSPDMDPSDFYLLPKLKSHLRGSQYGNNEGVTRKLLSILKGQESSGRDGCID